MRLLILGNTWTLIIYLYDTYITVVVYQYLYRTTFWRIFQGITDEVDHYLFQPVIIRLQHNRGRRSSQFNSTSCKKTLFFDYFAAHIYQITCFQPQLNLASTHMVNIEQVINQRVEAACLTINAL